jgi:DNA excision repair protein ERCC-2
MMVLAAPPGFGKTVSVLYAVKNLIEKGLYDRVFYAVRTRNELDPFIRESRLLKMRFAILYSGKRMCPLLYALPSNELSSEGFQLFCSAMRMHGKCRFYSRLQLFHPRILMSTVSDYTDHYSIAKGLAEKLYVCPYFAMIEAIEHAEALALTYPYIFKERIWKAVFKDVDTSRTILVIDEAHNLLNIGNVMGDSITLQELFKALSEVKELSVSSNVVHSIEMLIKELSKVKEGVEVKGYKHINKNILNVSRGCIDELKNALLNLMIKTSFDVNRIVISAIPRLIAVLELALDEAYEAFVYRDPQGLVVLSVMPQSFKPLKIVLERFSSVIALSATPPSSVFFKDVIGVDKKVHFIDVEDFGAKNLLKENAAIVVYTGATTSYRARSSTMFKKYAQLLEASYKALSRGVMLVVYPSYEVMRAIVSELPDIVNTITETSQPLLEVVRQVKVLDKAILNAVAGGRLAEGIEIVEKGESIIRLVIIIGVPYPQPDDYTQAIVTEINRAGGSSADFFKEVATVRVLQAIGRAIRSEQDRAMIVLSDSRYISQQLLSRLGLRATLVTNRIDVIAKAVVQFYDSLTSPPF